MSNDDLIKTLILQVSDKCLTFISKGEDGLYYFIDPLNKKEISNHYSASHAAASFLMLGSNNAPVLYEKGVNLLKSILARWDQSTKLPAFHFDFNNFALAVAVDYVQDSELSNRVKNIVCVTQDSNHNTVNWLPMRAFVNYRRSEWKHDESYAVKADECLVLVKQATNNDGGIEDRLPKGKSFNLQYDVSTVAELQFLKNLGVKVDIGKNLGFLEDSILPDGDINYMGRGCNQIFAWGPWIYLLSSSGNEARLGEALNFLNDGKLTSMLNNNNLMLNEYDGRNKSWWWDYHYSSVYISHLLFWLILALRDHNKFLVNPDSQCDYSTGLQIYKDNNAFVSAFNGRSEYLAEAGPSIVGIWTKKYGTIFKGVFGPWQGLFGNQYIIDNQVIKNCLGLIEVKRDKNFTHNRILRKINPIIKHNVYCKYSPLFNKFDVNISEKCILIQWRLKCRKFAYLNVALCIDNPNLELSVDGKQEEIFHTGTFFNQYGIRYLFQSRSRTGNQWILKINLN